MTLAQIIVKDGRWSIEQVMKSEEQPVIDAREAVIQGRPGSLGAWAKVVYDKLFPFRERLIAFSA